MVVFLAEVESESAIEAEIEIEVLATPAACQSEMGKAGHWGVLAGKVKIYLIICLRKPFVPVMCQLKNAHAQSEGCEWK